MTERRRTTTSVRVGDYVLVYLSSIRRFREVVRVTRVHIKDKGECVFDCVTAEGTTHQALHGGYAIPPSPSHLPSPFWHATPEEVLAFVVQEAQRAPCP